MNETPHASNSASLDEVLCTDELRSRPAREPDYERENRALAALAQSLADAPETVLQRFTEVVMETLQAGSAGISLLTEERGEEAFYWPAIAGAWKPHIGSGLPRDASPCGVVLQNEAVQLFKEPERYYRFMVAINHPIVEALLAPFAVHGKTVGTVWVIAHDAKRTFDAEDARILESLSRFAAAAYQTWHTHEDIETKRRALAESEQRFREMADHAPIMVWVTGADGHCSYLSKGWYDFTGQNEGEGFGLGWTDMVHPEDRERTRRAFLDANKQSGPFWVEYRLRRKDGEYRWAIDSAHPHLGPDGEFLGYVGSVVDIHERKVAETQARLRSEQFEMLLKQAPIGVYLVDGDFRIAQINPIAHQVFAGVREVIGRDFGEVLHEMIPQQPADGIVRAFRRTLETGEPFHNPEFAEHRVDRGVIEYYDWRIERIILPEGGYGVVCYFTDISEQVRARNAIADWGERYYTLFNSVDEGFCVIEVIFDEDNRPVDYRFIETNPVFERHTGLRDAVGRTIREMVPDLEEHWFEIYGRVALTGEPVRFENRARAMENRWFDVYAFRVGEPEERKIAILFNDVTQRRKAELKLREQESFYRQTLESIPGMTFTNRPDGWCDYVSQQWVEFTGVPAKQQHGDGWVQVLHPDDRQRAYDAWRSAVEGRGRYDLDYRVRRRDGEYEWFKVRGQAIRDASEEIVRWFGAAVNVDDLKRAEEALRKSEERLLLAKSAAQLGIHDYNIVRKTIDWDKRTRELWGADADEQITYETWLSGIHPDDREQAQQAVQRALDPEGDGVYFAEYRVIHRHDQSTRWVQATGQVAFANGQPVRLVGTALDITRQKRAEESLREADRRKDEFLATLAHELRNPLAAIRMAAGLLKRGSESPAQTESLMGIVDRQSSQLTRLIDDLLDVNRITRGKIELRTQPVDLNSIVTHAAESTRTICDSSGLQFSVSLSPKPLVVMGDPTRLSQVIGNLLSNACKFTEEGGHVGVEAEEQDGDALVRVRDTGIGIAPDKLPYIFEMFAQIDTTDGRAKSGLGIGLSLAQRLISMHGGTIEARSEGEGKGSEFTIRLPLIAAPPQASPAELSMHAGRSLSSAQHCDAMQNHRRRILAVDDNRDALDTVAMLLKLAGHEVHIAEDGEQAIAAAEAHRPDVMLLDIGLPGIDGYEVARRIRKQPWGRDLHLIAMTGWGQEKDRQSAMDAGFDAHVTKPADPGVLEKLLAQGERA